jgi:branched-chain amino acid transport system ATP-binding protein
MLEVRDLVVSYGGIRALKGISFNVPDGQIVSLIGANGAGKSTTVRAISGLVRAAGGSILFDNKEILNLPAHQIVALGICQIPEGRKIFANLTVLENLYMGAYMRRDKEGIKQDLQRIFDIFPRLRERLRQTAGTLSGGEQQMLAVARALMARPKLLMMDEPSLGLAPIMVREVFNIIKEINQRGVTILLIEQNAMAALRIANYGYVLETGSIVLEGTGQQLINNPSVRQAYLGEVVG